MSKKSKFHTYVIGSGSGIISKAISVVAAFANLWLLNQILSKDQFGSYAFSMSAITILSILFSLGQDRAIFYKLAGIKNDDIKIEGASLVYHTIRRLFLYNLLMLLTFFIIVFMNIQALKSHLFWLVCLSLIIPLLVINQVLINWFQSQQRFVVSLLIPRVEDVLETVFLVIALIFCPNCYGVAFSLIGSSLLTVVAWYWFLPPIEGEEIFSLF